MSSSSPVRPSVRRSAWPAVVFGVAGAIALPVAVAVAFETNWWSYLESTWAAVPATVLGILAILLGRRGKRRERRAVLGVAGAGTARWGWRLGWLALYFAATAGLALAVYELETYLSA